MATKRQMNIFSAIVQGIDNAETHFSEAATESEMKRFYNGEKKTIAEIAEVCALFIRYRDTHTFKETQALIETSTSAR